MVVGPTEISQIVIGPQLIAVSIGNRYPEELTFYNVDTNGLETLLGVSSF